MVREVQAERAVAVGIVIAIGSETVAGNVDAGCLVQGRSQVKTRTFVAAGESEAALVSAVAAGGQARVRFEAGAIALAGEDLNDTANGIGTVERRAGAAHHFDTLYLLRCKKFQAAGAAGGSRDALASDQHQGLSRAGAAHKDAHLAACAAGADDAKTRYALQQLGNAADLQPFDILPFEHRGSCSGLRLRLCLAYCGNH